MNINNNPLFTDKKSKIIIAGPCSAESHSQVIETARALADIGVKIFRAGVWKPRTRPGGFEGMGVAALEWLKDVKAQTHMMIATEVGCCSHVRKALEADVDILWIGARTTTSPFAVQEIAEELRGTDKIVLVKNPVSADLPLWIGALERLNNAGITRLAAIHRGFKSCSGSRFRNEPHWEIVDKFRKEVPELPVICDPSHICGCRELIPEVTNDAISRTFSGLMLESHIDPSSALTDASQQLTPTQLSSLLTTLQL